MFDCTNFVLTVMQHIKSDNETFMSLKARNSETDSKQQKYMSFKNSGYACCFFDMPDFHRHYGRAIDGFYSIKMYHRIKSQLSLNWSELLGNQQNKNWFLTVFLLEVFGQLSTKLRKYDGFIFSLTDVLIANFLYRFFVKRTPCFNFKWNVLFPFISLL